MSNMKITMYMASPIATTGFIYLDGLLAAAVMKEKLGDEYYNNKPNEQELIDIDLPLVKQYGVWCASVGFGDNREAVASWSKRWDDKNDDIVKFKGKGKARVDIGSGHFKNYHMPLVIKSYKTINFYAKGDIKEVERLLTTYITHIGKKASQGYGEILNMKFEEIDEDYSQFKGGRPTRPIPVSQYPEYKEWCLANDIYMIIAKHPIKPPYWRTDCIEWCYMP